MSDPNHHAGQHLPLRHTPDDPFLPFSRYLRQRFGQRVYKVTLDAGLTCPNRDGTVSTEGCTFCNNEGFCVQTGGGQSLPEQLEQGMAFMRHRYKANKFIPYFQAYSNTYGTVGELKRLYDQVALHPDAVGFSVATRPDCVSAEVLDLLASYANDDREVWIEYGLQSAHDETLDRINRGHDVGAFARAMELTEARRLKVCVQLILGLPGEDREMMLQTIEFLSRFVIHGVKLHALHVLPDTQLEVDYREGRLSLLELDDYVRIACDVMERLAPDIVIQRLSGDAPAGILIAPDWCADKALVRTRILSEFARRGTCQGARHRKPPSGRAQAARQA